MVAYQAMPYPRQWSSSSKNEYWKLGNYAKRRGTHMKRTLRKANYKFPTSAVNKRMAQIMPRYERGLLSYDGCLISELRTFCIQRGLEMPTERKARKGQLVQILEAADEEAEFAYLMDLPAELRVYIYTLYFESLPKLETPAQPPVSKVSQILRQESLPVFYNTCTFIFRPIVGRIFYGQPSILGYRWNALDFFFKTPEEHLKAIHNVIIRNYLSDYADEEVHWTKGKTSFSSPWKAAVNEPSALGQAIATFLEGKEGLTTGTIIMLSKLIRGKHEKGRMQ